VSLLQAAAGAGLADDEPDALVSWVIAPVTRSLSA